ncbi:hypothetical protein SETIT_5G409200v2 [Setaria italica]|uniref:CRIB domain-containing protein n=1 Tax=Setaria italica TaxID=4555 RepID=A0A368REF3_SETIT|nr:hypothetical protein SETIT_5G409200v2 [Setaria italica]
MMYCSILLCWRSGAAHVAATVSLTVFLLRLGLHQVSTNCLLPSIGLFRASWWTRALSTQGGGVDDDEGGLAAGEQNQQQQAMEIGWPTDVRHVAHVTFDRLHGFRGVPEELQREVEGRPPSASTTVLGVSTESMQCSYDGRGNSVLTILLHLQRRLYDQRAASPRRASSGSPPTEPRSSARGTSSTTPASFRTASTCIAWQGC